MIALLGFAVTALVSANRLLQEASVLGGSIYATFTSDSKQASAATRPYQLEQAWALFQSSPLVGVGTGMGNVNFFDQYSNTYTPTDSAHNIIADIAIRWGIIGLILFTCVLAFAAIENGRLTNRSNFLIVVALATVLAKGLFEPALDKYRLVAMLAICVTAMCTSQTLVPDFAARSRDGLRLSVRGSRRVEFVQ